MWKPTFLTVTGASRTIYYNAEKSLWLWSQTPLIPERWLISETLLQLLDVDGNSYGTDYRTFNGQLVYPLTAGFYLWKEASPSRWVISKFVGFGTAEYWDEDTEEYKGDEWWTRSTLEGEYAARGSLRGVTEGAYEGAVKDVEMLPVNGWESTSLLGEYSAVADGGATGKQHVGWKNLSGDNGIGYLTQIALTSNDKFVFRSNSGKFLWFDGANWIINSTPGTKDPDSGYWSGSTPPSPSSTTAVYNRVYSGEGTPPSPSSYTLTFGSYVAGSETSTELQGQVAVWL